MLLGLQKKIEIFFSLINHFSDYQHNNSEMFAFILLFVMYTGAFWYTPPTPPKKQQKQFTVLQETSSNVTYDRSHLF